MHGHKHIIQHRHLRKQANILEGPPKSQSRNFMGRQIGDFFSIEENAALRRRVQAGNNIEQCRFARAVGANDADDLALIYMQSNVSKCGQTAELLGNIFNREQAGHYFPSFLR